MSPVAWVLTGVVPVGLGLVLWWRGGLVGRSELSAGDLRTEFVLVGGAALTLVVMTRGLPNPPAGLLEGASLVFVASGLLALGLARQDAAQAQPTGGARSLAAVAAAAPTGSGLLLAAVLTPAVVAAIWAAFGSLLQVLLAPLLALLQWLASLVPRPTGPLPLPPALNRPLPPDLTQIERQAGPPAWLVWLVLGLFVLVAVALVIVLVRLLLAWTAARAAKPPRPEAEVQSEGVGSPRGDARALLDWLWAWLRRLLGAGSSQPAAGTRAANRLQADADARAAYRSLLAWARAQGVVRGAAETTQQFRHRLARHAPEAAPAVDLVTDVYEHARYGERPPTPERFALVTRQLDALRTAVREQPPASGREAGP
jgi:hypothetical protein